MKLSDEGEVLVKGAMMAKGYLHAPLDCIDGWYRTKDLGELQGGNLVIHGRLDRMIISGGENIHLEDLEVALLSLGEVERVIASHRTDHEWGQRPKVHVWAQGLQRECIQKRLRASLPPFKVPSIEDIHLMRS